MRGMVDKMAFSKMKNRSENTGSANHTNNDHNSDDILAFVRNNIRYITAGALFLLLILVLVNCGASRNGSGEGETVVNTETETEEAFQIDAYEEVNALIQQYLTAYAEGDVDTITSLAAPVSDTEKSYIAEYSKYIDSYQNIKCYTKHGLDDKSYMVSVYLEIKFTDAETAAPGLDFFYIRTNDDNTLTIDNLYSQYNSRMQENALDTSVQSLIDQYESSEDMIALQREVQEKYDAALAADATLTDVVTNKIPTAITEWRKALLAQNSEGETETAAETETSEEPAQPETESSEETVEAEEPVQPAETNERVYTTDVVNVRASADTAAEKLGTLEKGTAITRNGTEGEWSIVNYGGVTGYIMTEFLTTEEPQEEAAADNEPQAGGSLSEGTVITLTDSVNIRAGMSETAEKIGTAFPGEKVTVVMSYAEGWTKINWNNKIGYIKTSLLQ